MFQSSTNYLKPAQGWHDDIERSFGVHDETLKQVAALTLAIGLLVVKSQRSESTSEHELDFVWTLISTALKSPALYHAQFKANRSAQGFLAIPLCSIVVNGNIDLLFRLHVWLPDGQRGAPGFDIHSHQPFAQSWILAGYGKDNTYEVVPVSDAASATHARYALAWSSGSALDTTYKTQQTYSKVVNTGDFMHAKLTRTSANSRNMSYYIPAASFHSSEVAPDILHATLFLFDSSRGFERDAPVLGPASSEHHTQVRHTPGVSLADLVELVDSTRRLEAYLTNADRHLARCEWHEAFSLLEKAELLRQAKTGKPHSSPYQQLIVDKLAFLLGQQTTEVTIPSRWRDVYERALSLVDQPRGDLKQIDPGHGTTQNNALRTSEQHVQQLQRLSSVDVDSRPVVADGASHLERAVLGEDHQEASRHTLSRKIDGDLHHHLREANVQEHFLKVFKNILRPILVMDDLHTIKHVRQAYAETLSYDTASARVFDNFKYVLYQDLITAGRIPKSSDGFTRTYDACTDKDKYFIFVSYRWLNTDPPTRQHNDRNSEQYLHTLKAIEEFLTQHQIDRQRLGIWVDFACIDADSPGAGVAALPLILTQCDAMISLVDDEYYSRAWCCIEAMMMHALQTSYGKHLWYEYKKHANPTVSSAGSPNQIILSNKLLTFEDDRPWVVLLEKLSKSLG